MRRLVNTSIFLSFGLMMFQTFGAGCTARVQVGDDSGSGRQEVGPDGAAGGVEPSAGSGGFSSTSAGSSVAVGAGGGDSAPTAGAIALFKSQLPREPSNDSGSSSSAGGGPDTDPDDLFIMFGAPVTSCANPAD